MKPWEFLAEATSADGAILKLTRHDGELMIVADGAPLMSSRMHGSEEALATLGCRRARLLPKPCVLVGGLGMGFTLRAALDLLPSAATVVVAELLPAVVEWNRGVLGPLAGHPLDDRRVRIEERDVAQVLRSNRAGFDAVLLDTDNAPRALTVHGNAALYSDRGIADARTALKPGGTLAIWSSYDDQRFVQRLRSGGFDVAVERVRGRLTTGPQHVIFLADVRPAGRTRKTRR
jgi:spermidine synthase